MLARFLRFLAVALSAFMIVGLCAATTEAQGVRRVSGVSVAEQDWAHAKLKIRWRPVTGARYQMRVAARVAGLKSSPVIPSRSASGTYARKLSRTAASYVQVRAIKRGTRGRWSAATRVRFTAPTAAVQLRRRKPPVTNGSGAPGTSRKVFAHYFPPYPISLDNQPSASDYYATQYLNINGENGKFAAVGGLLRDRPIGRSPLSGDWQLADLRTEVRQAKSAGIDGFTLDIMTTSGSNWTAAVNLMRAAQDVGGFTVVPMVDASAQVASATPAALAAKLAQLYAFPSAQVIDGSYVLSTFAAELKTPTWWNQVITELVTTQHLPIKFIADFLNASYSNMTAFAPISYGFGNWGVRTVESVTHAPNYAAMAHSLGRKWMEPVAFQDARPSSSLYAEASNTATGRATWNKAISNAADFVQIVTWNDYSESTSVAPSMAHGRVLLDISAYYISQFKTGQRPAISADHLYLTHRHHPFAANPTSGIVNMTYTLGGMNTPPQDTVEALVFLTAPATVSITTSAGTRTFSQPAGVSAVTVPLAVGSVSARVVRNSGTALAVNSPFTVVLTPFVQDFQYWAAGS